MWSEAFIMRHQISSLDKSFLCAFESATLDISTFRHREHLRIAYILLVQNDLGRAVEKARFGLRRLWEQNGITRDKYHETLTVAWIQAVNHFMLSSTAVRCADEFLAHNPQLLNKDIIYTHYSEDVILSQQSRSVFVPPDLSPIPIH